MLFYIKYSNLLSFGLHTKMFKVSQHLGAVPQLTVFWIPLSKNPGCTPENPDKSKTIDWQNLTISGCCFVYLYCTIESIKHKDCHSNK